MLVAPPTEEFGLFSGEVHSAPQEALMSIKSPREARQKAAAPLIDH